MPIVTECDMTLSIRPMHCEKSHKAYIPAASYILLLCFKEPVT